MSTMDAMDAVPGLPGVPHLTSAEVHRVIAMDLADARILEGTLKFHGYKYPWNR